MASSGARRVVHNRSSSAPERQKRLSRWRQWRDGMGPAVTGAFAAIQAAIITFLAVNIPALAAYLATSSDPSLDASRWWNSVNVGTDIWLLGHGGTTRLDDALISLAPLGITVLALLAVSGMFRRSVPPIAAGWVGTVLTYPLVVGILGALVATSAGRGGLWKAVLGAVGIAVVGASSGLWRHSDAPSRDRMIPTLWRRAPQWVKDGVRGGIIIVAAQLAIAGLIAALWIFQGQRDIGDVLLGLGEDWISRIVFAALQLLFVPNLVVWAFAWVSGAGFSVGTGTVWAPDVIISGPLPALPIFGALPQPDTVLFGRWVLLIPVLAGVLAGWRLIWRAVDRSWYMNLVTAAIASVVAGAGAFLISWLSQGSIGPGRMMDVGPHLAKVALFTTGTAFVGLAVIVLLAGRAMRVVYASLRTKLRESP